MTEHDIVSQGAAEVSIPFVDLRAILANAAKTTPVYFRGDTHWNSLGALIAFNQVVAAVGFTQAILNVEELFDRVEPKIRDGDLVRFAGMRGHFVDDVPVIRTNRMSVSKEVTVETLPSGLYEPTYIVTTDNVDGPKVLVIGDSFTQRPFRPLLTRLASTLVWTHHRLGHFDRTLLNRYDPDIVVLQLVERYIGIWRVNP